jgi:uncharacterized membrane-anchored protein YitT (DUF2179 family)
VPFQNNFRTKATFKKLIVVLVAALLLVSFNLFVIKLAGILSLATGFFFLTYLHRTGESQPILSIILSLIIVNLGYIFSAYLIQRSLESTGNKDIGKRTELKVMLVMQSNGNRVASCANHRQFP